MHCRLRTQTPTSMEADGPVHRSVGSILFNSWCAQCARHLQNLRFQTRELVPRRGPKPRDTSYDLLWGLAARRFGRRPVRSIYVKMLLWSFVTLMLALVAFYGISMLVSSRAAAH